MGDTHKREGIDNPRRVMGLNNKDIETSASNLGRQLTEKTPRDQPTAKGILMLPTQASTQVTPVVIAQI